jgi:hypothetical protein
MKRLAAWLVLLPTLTFADALPQGSAGAVTLEWQKFNDLWMKMQALEKKVEQLEHPEDLPPVPFTLSKAAYKGEVGAQRVEVTALFEIDVFQKKNWVKVPFLPSTVALADAKLDGAAAGVLEGEGFHEVVVRGPGRHLLSARFSLKAPKAEEAPNFQIGLANTPMTVVSLAFPQKNLDVTLEPSQGLESRPSASGGTLVTAVIPPTSRLEVRWQKAVTEENAGPTKLYVESEQLMTLSEGTARSRWELHYTILHRGTREVQLLAPEGWNILNVTGEGLQEWKVSETPKGAIIQVPLAYAKKGDLVLVVEAERGLGEKDAVIEAPRLRPLDVEREAGVIALEAKGSVELKVEETQGLNPIDPQELPPTVWQAATQPLLFAYRYTKPYQLAVNLTRHAEVPVLTTTIDDANAMTLMTSRGQAITRVRYQVRNHLKQYLSLKLPAGAELWSAFVSGAPVKPISEGKSTYRIPLAKSQIESAGQQGFPIEVVYYQTSKGWWPVGRHVATFPVPDAPISRLYWSMYLPERYRFIHFGGDLEAGAQAEFLPAVFGAALLDKSDRKDIAEGRHELKALEKNMGLAGRSRSRSGIVAYDAEMPGSAAKQAAFEEDVLQSRLQQSSVGVFPVAFEVPASGQLFRFGQVMIVDGAPRLSMTYLHVTLVRIISLGLLGLLLALAWRFRAPLRIAAMAFQAAAARFAAKLSTLRALRTKEA